MVATNAVRNFAPEVAEGIGAVTGIPIDLTPGERLPDATLDAAQQALSSLIARPEDIADAVHHVVSLPRRLNIPSLVVRAARTLPL